MNWKRKTIAGLCGVAAATSLVGNSMRSDEVRPVSERAEVEPAAAGSVGATASSDGEGVVRLGGGEVGGREKRPAVTLDVCAVSKARREASKRVRSTVLVASVSTDCRDAAHRLMACVDPLPAAADPAQVRDCTKAFNAGQFPGAKDPNASGVGTGSLGSLALPGARSGSKVPSAAGRCTTGLTVNPQLAEGFFASLWDVFGKADSPRPSPVDAVGYGTKGARAIFTGLAIREAYELRADVYTADNRDGITEEAQARVEAANDQITVVDEDGAELVEAGDSFGKVAGGISDYKGGLFEGNLKLFWSSISSLFNERAQKASEEAMHDDEDEEADEPVGAGSSAGDGVGNRPVAGESGNPCGDLAFQFWRCSATGWKGECRQLVDALNQTCDTTVALTTPDQPAICQKSSVPSGSGSTPTDSCEQKAKPEPGAAPCTNPSASGPVKSDASTPAACGSKANTNESCSSVKADPKKGAESVLPKKPGPALPPSPKGPAGAGPGPVPPGPKR